MKNAKFIIPPTMMTPGSDEAHKQGCSCPVLDNNHGKGVLNHEGEVSYWINDRCNIHGQGKGFYLTKE